MASHQFLQQLGIFTIPEFLTPEECAHWRRVAVASGGVEARIYRDQQGLHDESARKTLEVALDDPRRLELEQRITALQTGLERHYGVTLNGLDQLSCLRYRAGDFFRMHADVPESGSEQESAEFAAVYRRCVSIVIFLNHPGHDTEPYQGGALSLFGLMNIPASGDFGFPVEAETGLLVAFPATMLHEVSPVTAGNRYTLVSWFMAGERQQIRMPITTTSKPKRRVTIQSQPLPDGSGLLFDPAGAVVYPVSQSAMRIWQLCDGGHQVASILDELQEHYEIDRLTLEQDTLKLLEDLAEKQLLASN
jgi:predicted 2-oxoglutarate/Fe(II)-dependent dioxygenase YbiX